jgi:vacuolar-type H+-ATPase subunit H
MEVNLLAKEAVLQIKDAEEKSILTLREATERVRNITESAVSDAEEQAAEVIKKAENKRDKILKDAEFEADKQSAPLMDECENDIRKILNPSKDKFELAVKTVAERIVNVYGNSQNEPIYALNL